MQVYPTVHNYTQKAEHRTRTSGDVQLFIDNLLSEYLAMLMPLYTHHK